MGAIMAHAGQLDLEHLLAPVRVEQACGDDLTFSSEIDGIQRARQADDPSIEQGAWVTELKEADWKFVAKQCGKLIATRSKDLQLAVWLAEASAKTGGLAALADSLLLIAMLCELHWDDMYPALADDGVEQRIGNLAWVAAKSAQWVRDMPRTTGPASACTALLEDAGQCLAAVDRLERSVDARLAADGPSFSAVRSAIQDIQSVLAPLAGQGAGAKGGGKGGETAADKVTGAASALVGGAVETRAQALGQLRAVADFFRRTEPHSPVAYLAEKAAAWGEQPLHVWLRSVIKDDASFAHVEELLGVAPRQG
jgi:type VI secretion system protein ImpA